MKSLPIYLLIVCSQTVCPLMAQSAGGAVINFASAIIENEYGTNNAGQTVLVDNVKYTWEILRNPDGSKTFKYIAYKCDYELSIQVFGGVEPIRYFGPVCTPLLQSEASQLAPVQIAMTMFFSLAPSVPHNTVYGPFAQQSRATVQPAQPADPAVIFFDGLGNNLVKFDLNTFSPIAQVTVPNQASVFGILPTAAQDVVWQSAIAGGTYEIAIVDLTAKQVTGTIPIPSLVLGNTVPIGIVFTNSGATALYAVSYFNADSSGNKGALLAFDVGTRRLKSTMQLSFTPSKLLMAPDGLTAYLLGDDGTILYYDIVSGTADLKANTATPGVASGFSSLAGNAFLLPDGTRLLWNANDLVYSWDLTTRKLIATFHSGISSLAGTSMQMSQDGATVTLLASGGDAVVMDTTSGNILAKYSTAPTATVLFPGPGLP